MNHRRIAVVAVVAGLVATLLLLDVGNYLSLETLKTRQAEMEAWRAEHPLRAALIYFVVYVLVTAVSLPGAAVMTLAGGAIFGLWWGLLLVSFASSVGATLAFIVARLLLRHWVERKFGSHLRAVNRGVERDGAFYLFALRLVPLVPFFLINLGMALTSIRTWTFYWVSQVGMLAGTVVYVNAGTQLGRIESVSGILSPTLIGSFVLLGLFPLLAQRALAVIGARRAYRGWSRPAHFDRNLLVIGAGSGGLVAAYIAAAVGARVSLVERHRMGGDCLHTGCVPSKALIQAARRAQWVRQSGRYGIQAGEPRVDFPRVMAHVRAAIARIEPHDSVERYTGLGVEVILGSAHLVSPWAVRVDGRVLTARSIVIATGATPQVPPIPGLDGVQVLTSENLWELDELPARLLVLGGGPIGCELAQAFARLGSAVTVVEMLPRLLIREDPEFSERVLERFRAEGIDVRTGHRAVRVKTGDPGQALVCEHGGNEVSLPFDRILVAVGRKPSSRGFGLEELGISLDRTGAIEVNEFLQTRYPNIYAVGDVTGPYQFTHTASHQAWFAAVNGLFGTLRRFRVDYSVIPWATFTDPEIARVGLNELEAREQGIAYEVTTYALEGLDRAIADGEADGLVKVLTVPGRDRILGATIAGSHAGEMITEFITAMRHGLGLNKLLSTIHIYPTWSEANRHVAGEWKRAHAPQGLLRWVRRYLAWRRGRTTAQQGAGSG